MKGAYEVELLNFRRDTFHLSRSIKQHTTEIRKSKRHHLESESNFQWAIQLPMGRDFFLKFSLKIILDWRAPH